METARIVSILSQLFIIHSCSKYVVRNDEVLKEKKTRKEKQREVSKRKDPKKPLSAFFSLG